jgi:hypothetical protein
MSSRTIGKGAEITTAFLLEALTLQRHMLPEGIKNGPSARENGGFRAGSDEAAL